MSGPLQEKITEQIQDILSSKEIFDYSIRFCDGKRKLILKVNEDADKCIGISYEKFTDAVAQAIKISRTYEPNEESSRAVLERKAIYLELCESMKSSWQKMDNYNK